MRKLRQLTSSLCLLCMAEVAAGQPSYEYVSDPALAIRVKAALASCCSVDQFCTGIMCTRRSAA